MFRALQNFIGLRDARVALTGAAPISPAIVQFFRTLGVPLIEVYGMTENSGVSHSTLPGSRQTGSVGLPYTGVESRVDTETGEITQGEEFDETEVGATLMEAPDEASLDVAAQYIERVRASGAAERLGIKPTTLTSRLKKLGIPSRR